MSRSSSTLALSLLLCATLQITLRAADAPPVQNGDAAARRREATDKGLKWLAANLQPKVDGKVAPPPFHVPGYAFAGLAFMGSGTTLDRGDYKAELKICLDGILADCQPTGLIAGKTGDVGQMYGHGYAMLFLAEVYTSNHDAKVKEKLEAAVSLLEKSQSTEGGWRYQPKKFDADVSVTACELNALLAARDAGIGVPKDVIERATRYVRRCQNEDGGFSYMPHLGSSGVPRSAAAAAVLSRQALAEDKDALDRALKYLDHTFGPEPVLTPGHLSYAVYYAGQYLPRAGGDRAAANLPALADALIKTQKPDGSWSHDFFPQYSTACILLALESPNAKLTIFGNQPPP